MAADPRSATPSPTPRSSRAASTATVESAAAPPAASGGLLVLGCRWRVASDDLVLPAWAEFVLRCASLGVVAGVLAFEEVAEDSCASEYHLDVYLWVAVALYLAILADLLALALESARGVVWDRDPDVRKRVRVFFAFLISIF